MGGDFSLHLLIPGGVNSTPWAGPGGRVTAVPRPVVPSGVCAAGHHRPELLQTRLRSAVADPDCPSGTLGASDKQPALSGGESQQGC